jgi:hypothetical protein
MAGTRREMRINEDDGREGGATGKTGGVKRREKRTDWVGVQFWIFTEECWIYLTLRFGFCGVVRLVRFVFSMIDLFRVNWFVVLLASFVPSVRIVFVRPLVG